MSANNTIEAFFHTHTAKAVFQFAGTQVKYPSFETPLKADTKEVMAPKRIHNKWGGG